MAWASNDKEAKKKETSFDFLENKESGDTDINLMDGGFTSTSIRLPNKLIAICKDISTKKGLNLGNWIRMILVEEVQRQLKKKRVRKTRKTN